MVHAMWVNLLLVLAPRAFCYILRFSPLSITLNLLFSPPPPADLFISNTSKVCVCVCGGGGCWEETGAYFRGGGLFDLAKTMVSVHHKELEYKLEKLKYKKLEVMQPRFKNLYLMAFVSHSINVYGHF